jgi:hypothetical protein
MGLNVKNYRKAVIAVSGGLVLVATAVAESVADGSIDLTEIVTVITAVAVAVGVYEIRNEEEEKEA